MFCTRLQHVKPLSGWILHNIPHRRKKTKRPMLEAWCCTTRVTSSALCWIS